MPYVLAPARPAQSRTFSVLRLLNWIARRQEDRRMRQSLLELDAHLLADIGITRAQALHEAGAGEWPAPDHWTNRLSPPHQ